MRTLFHLFCFLSTLLGAAGQESVHKVRLAVFCFQPVAGLEEVFVRIGERSYQGLTLSTANMIGPITATVVNGDITIHQEVPDSPAKKGWPLVARAQVGSLDQPLVVLVPRNEGAGPPYRTFVIDRSASEFPAGSYRLLNFSPHPVRARVGGRLVVSASGTLKKLQPVSVPGKLMAVEFEFHDGNRWRPMTTGRWAYRRDRRTLLCLYLDPLDQRMKIRSIPDRLVAQKTTSP